LIPHPLLHRLAKIDRAGSRRGIALQFDIAEFARGASLDAVTQAHELQRAPGLGSSVLSNTRPGIFVPEAVRHSQATIIRHLRLLTIIAAGSWQAQPPGPFGR
jgi:hypothetical protein